MFKRIMNKKIFFIVMIIVLILLPIAFSINLKTKNEPFDFSEEVVKLEENKIRMVFSSELNLSDVCINFSINGSGVKSISMKKNGELWVCDISEIYSDDNIEYWYTCKYKSFFVNTNWLNYYL